jgi:hypothetical protein
LFVLPRYRETRADTADHLAIDHDRKPASHLDEARAIASATSAAEMWCLSILRRLDITARFHRPYLGLPRQITRHFFQQVNIHVKIGPFCGYFEETNLEPMRVGGSLGVEPMGDVRTFAARSTALAAVGTPGAEIPGMGFSVSLKNPDLTGG